MKLIYAAFTSLCLCFLHAEEKICSAGEESRVKALTQWDEAIDWVVPLSSRTFFLQEGVKPLIYKEKSSALNRFVSLHGYFSCYKPLVGLVTEDPSDMRPIQEVFNALVKEKNRDWVELVVQEILSKAVAYRTLQKGMKITLPVFISRKIKKVEFVVDEVLDLWQGMPAFGLLPVKKDVHPILLFRGTDFSFVSKSSWASILSDFDLAGAGLTTFKGSEKKIQMWLDKASSFGKKSHVMGFSLGGILAIYTAVFQPELVDSCIAFNSPGVSKSVFQTWKELKSSPSIYIYATQGDLISRFSKMVGKAFEISDKTSMGPIKAHTQIMLAESPISIFPIDIEKENKTRFKPL